jgi:hypothetical protein
MYVCMYVCMYVRLQARPEGMSASEKATYVLYHFCDGLKFQNQVFGSHEASNAWIWILCPLWLCALTLPTQP